MNASSQYVTDLSQTGITFPALPSLEWVSRCSAARTPLAIAARTSFHTSGNHR